MAEQSDLLLSKVAEAVSKATAAAMVEAQAKFQTPENRQAKAHRWNEKTPGCVRPKLTRKTYFCGTEQRERQMTDEEIELFNQVTPGRYHDRQWEVIQRDDGTNEPSIEVRVPCKTPDERMMMPPSLVHILTEIIEEAKTRDVPPASGRRA